MKNICYLGFYNRKKLYRDIIQKQDNTIILFDINDFCFVNFIYSKETGNQALKSFGERITKAFDGIKPYRIGDKFIILLTILELQKKKDIIEKIKLFCEEQKYNPIDINSHQVILPITVGIAEGEKLLEKSELAVKLARKKNIDFIVYDISEFENFYNQKYIYSAIVNGNIFVLYQPIANKNKEIVKYEALVRIEYEGKILTPDKFLEASKTLKIYSKITKEVILQALETFKNREEIISINIGYDDVATADTENFIFNQVINFKDRARISFEIIESEKIEDYTLLQNFIIKYLELGVLFSLDDFGVGYSNFGTLKKLKGIKNIKIDGEFIKNCNEKEKNKIALDSLIQISKKLKKEITGEFIENEETFNLLNSQGIDFFQGYYIGKPIKL